MSGNICKKIAVFILTLLSIVCFAEDTQPAGGPWQGFGGDRNMRGNRGNRGNRGEWGNRRNRGNRGNRGNRDNRSGMMEIMPLMMQSRRIIAFEKIREKFPKECAELNKIILDTEKKYAELAGKAEVELQESLESRLIRLQNADPAGYDAAFKAINNNPRTGFIKLNELAKKHKIELVPSRRVSMQQARKTDAPSTNRNIMRPDFRKLRSKFPEEMKKYEAIRRENPAKAKEMLTDMIKRLNESSDKK